MVTPVGHPASAGTAPAAVTVITAEELRAFGFRTLQEALDGLRMFQLDTASKGVISPWMKFPDYDARLLLLLNGHRLNDAVLGSAWLDALQVSMDDIEKIEIAHGPGSALYGSNAMLAVINIITKGGKDINGLRLVGEAGRRDAYKGGIAYGKGDEKSGTLLSAERYKSGGREVRFREFSYSTVGLADREKSSRLFLSASEDDYTLTGSYLEREKAIPTAPFGSIFNSRKSEDTNKRGFLSLDYNAALPEKRLLTARVYYDEFYWKRDIVIAVGGLALSSTNLQTTEASASLYGTEIRYSEPWLKNHYLTTGYEHHRHESIKFKKSDEWATSPAVNIERSYTVWSAYIQDEYTSGNLALTLGYRFDSYPESLKGESPRADIVYRMGEKTVMKLLWGRAFRAPNIPEKYYSDGVTFKGNPSLAPEKITTYEAVLEQGIGKGHITLSAYRNEADGLINLVQDTDGFYVHRNIDEAVIKGIEASLSLKGKGATSPGANVSGGLKYTYQDTEDKRTGRRLPNSPRHSGNLRIAVPFKGLVPALEVNYLGERENISGAETGDSYVTNLTFSTAASKSLRFSASVLNIFDEEYSYPARTEDYPVAEAPQAGRSFVVKLTYILK